jgi:hypothetical protein
MKWIVAPVAAFVWMLHMKTQNHSTDIAVLKATTDANKQSHDREIKEIRENFKAVFEKLDSIEQALRK